MIEHFEEYICSNCTNAKPYCINMIIIQEVNITTYKCVNYKKKKYRKLKDQSVESYLNYKATLIN